MMSNIDLPAMIRECVDGRTEPVTAAEATARAATPVTRAPVRRGPRVAIGAGGLAAAGAVAALVASQVGGGGTAATRTVLTAAVIRQLASTSQAAMTSGQATIDWTSSGLPSVVQQISFNGGNWNDVLNPGQPTHITHTTQGITRSGETINRVVNGEQFHWPDAVMTATGIEFKGWFRIDMPGAGRPLGIPDPRTLLSVLSPSAGFVTDGTSTVNGITVSHLRATTPGAVAIAPLNAIIQSEPDGARLSAIDLWADANDVVQKAEVTVTGTNGKGVPQSVTVTVTFSQIGQLQPITAPSAYKTPGNKG
jgi:hypothetical protein